MTRVVDGDTLWIAASEQVRLLGVNTPELGASGAEGRLARQARQRVAARLAGGRVLLVEGRRRRDAHGRLLAHAFAPDGASLAAELVGAGLGWHVAIPPDLDLAPCLADLERAARREKRGVWRLPATPAGAVRREGFQRVVGRVVRVSFGRSWWLSLEGAVAVRIPPQSQPLFERRHLGRLVGRRVEVRGWLHPNPSRGHEPWRVELPSPYHLQVSAGKSGAAGLD
ncbi:MAG: nuclease [Porticoccaceae bacterium]|nr:MAG: nuclease [Porticoccaceae bacterium]